MVNKRELEKFFQEMESSGVADFAPENVVSVVKNPMGPDYIEDDEHSGTANKEYSGSKRSSSKSGS